MLQANKVTVPDTSDLMVDIVASVKDLPQDFQQLMNAASGESLQFGMSWMLNLEQSVFGEKDHVRYFTLRRNGQAVAVLPTLLARQTRGRHIAALGNYYTAIFQPAMLPGLPAAAWKPLLNKLRAVNAGLTSLTLSPMDPNSEAFIALELALAISGFAFQPSSTIRPKRAGTHVSWSQSFQHRHGKNRGGGTERKHLRPGESEKGGRQTRTSIDQQPSIMRANTESKRDRGRISEYRRELGLDFSVGIAKLAGSPNDWKHDGSCREVIVSDDARHGDLPAVKQHVPDSTKVRAPMRRPGLGWIAERTRGGADATRPASNPPIRIAQIVAEDVPVPDPVVGAGFIDIGIEPEGVRPRMIACEHDRLSAGISAIIRLPGTCNCGYCQGEQQREHSYVVWHGCDPPYESVKGDDALLWTRD